MKWTKEEDLGRYGIKPIAETKKIPLGNTNDDYQIYQIPIEFLKYNRSNGRIFMETNRLQEDDGINLKDLEETNVEEFNNEIEKLIWEIDVERNDDTKDDIYKYTQLESGVVLDDGTVIDGNRRFTCLRKLHKEFPLDARFNFFKTAIIFREGTSITTKDIKKYELKAQFGRDEKVDYKAVNFSMSIYKSVKQDGFTIQEIADDVNKKPGDITKIINACELVEEFLEYINQKNQLYVIESLNLYWPIDTLASYLCGNEGTKLTAIEKEKRKHIFFDYILTIDTELPTQEFRDNLIKKLFKDTAAFTELAQDYDEHYGEEVSNKILDNHDVPIDFVQKVINFRKTDTAAKIKKSYKKAVEKKIMEKQANAPIELCDDIIDKIKQINIDPFIDASSSTADNILRKVHSYLKDVVERTNEIDEKITRKIGIHE